MTTNPAPNMAALREQIVDIVQHGGVQPGQAATDILAAVTAAYAPVIAAAEQQQQLNTLMQFKVDFVQQALTNHAPYMSMSAFLDKRIAALQAPKGSK